MILQSWELLMPLIIGEVLFVNQALILKTQTKTTKKKPALQKLTNIKRSKLHTSNNAKQIGK